MKLLVNLLILSFIVLLVYQIFSHLFYDNLIEGLENPAVEYKPYPADPMILAQQNAGNIEYDIVGIKGHGVVAIDTSPWRAFEHIERLEHICQIVLASGKYE
jgi:ribulose-5-phosphate 4-epimerase/fuculose-1-phosphate aldolase